MTRRTSYSKSDVEFHHIGYDSSRCQPAVNVKVSFPYSMHDTCIRVATDDGYDTATAERFASWFDEQQNADTLPEWLFEAACESGWESLRSDAEEIFGSNVAVHSEGRSGGWCVIDVSPATASSLPQAPATLALKAALPPF